LEELYHPHQLNTAHSNIFPMAHADSKQAAINPGFACDLIGMTGSAREKISLPANASLLSIYFINYKFLLKYTRNFYGLVQPIFCL
jgi:hypothetical protein